MASGILGLHHVTATVNDAQADLDFCLQLLGLRLVKKTVNFDNHHVYHFYYGDELGTPGTIWTTFPYKGHGVAVGTHGAGQITTTSFSVPRGSLNTWRERLSAAGVAVTVPPARFGDESLTVLDPSGLIVELVGTREDPRPPWTGSGVGPPQAIRGLHSVTLTVAAAAPTIAFLERQLGFAVVATEGDRTRLAVNGDRPGHWLEVHERPAAPRGVNGLGTVHHVAMAIGSADEQLALREALLGAGARVTEVRDRQYFQSIYFREPGGVLYEVATVAPGFAVDEAPAGLGRDLKLPPWEEPHRAAIEAGLDRVAYRLPRAPTAAATDGPAS
jgi:glyoxalase family protein